MRLDTRRSGTVLALGTAQTLAWASSYYLPAVLAQPMAAAVGLQGAHVFAMFSAALLLAALIGPFAGRQIDRHGGRPVLALSNLGFAAGLALMALSEQPASLMLAWALMGLAMGAGLYEAAFATLVHLHRQDARGMITGITLIAGFASTVGWPLSSWLAVQWGWREACWTWAALHLLLGLPLNLSLPRRGAAAPASPPGGSAAPAQEGRGGQGRAMLALALVFALNGFIATAMAAHGPRLLQALGLGMAAAVAVAALIGPAQVAARLFEFGALRRVHPLQSARLATLAHPLGGLALLLLGAPAGLAFGLLHGMGNGLLTISKGALPLVMFGAQGYGQRQALLLAPGRVLQALAPWLFGLALERWQGQALWLSTGLGLLALLVLLRMRPHSSGPSA
jgi:MFS family permease